MPQLKVTGTLSYNSSKICYITLFNIGAAKRRFRHCLTWAKKNILLTNNVRQRHLHGLGWPTKRSNFVRTKPAKC